MQGIPPEKTQYWEEEKLRYQVLPFFNATYANNDVGFGAMCSYILKDSDTSSVNSSTTTLHSNQSRYARTTTAKMSSRDQRRLSLSTVQARSFQKQESQTASIIQQKGYKTFHPGVYEYSFEITLDHTSPESMSLPMGSVKWYLDAMVERAGTFKPNLHGVHELNVVRAPDQSNLETVEPIAINRSWEDQLHYDIVISGKSFPIGGRIPIAFKLTPLAKVQLHRIKVYVTENVEYFCNNRKVTRKDAQKKILLLEKNAGKPLAPEYSGSSIRNAAGGEQSPEARERARRQAEAWRQRLAKHSGQPYTPLPPPTDNLLGDLDLGLDHLVMQTEIEMDVQLPTCEQMAKDKTKLLHPGTTYKNIVVNHWIKVYSLYPLFFESAINNTSDRHAPLPRRHRRPSPSKTPPLRDLHRLPLPHPLLPRHHLPHLPTNLQTILHLPEHDLPMRMSQRRIDSLSSIFHKLRWP